MANITVKTPVGDTEEFTIINIVKQGTTHDPIICCAETSQVNNSEEPVKYQYEQVEVGVPVFMDNIMAAGDHDHVNKAVKSCRIIEETKKIHIRIGKDKIHDSQNRTCKHPKKLLKSKSGKNRKNNDTKVSWNHCK